MLTTLLMLSPCPMWLLMLLYLPITSVPLGARLQLQPLPPVLSQLLRCRKMWKKAMRQLLMAGRS